MKTYVCKYEYTNEFGTVRHIWSVYGARMGVHLHISDLGEERAAKYADGRRYSGGIELHYRTPPDYMRDQAPASKACWLIGGPCWHDGSSLQADERWIPLWQSAPHDHERMFLMLQCELDAHDRRETGEEQESE